MNIEQIDGVHTKPRKRAVEFGFQMFSAVVEGSGAPVSGSLVMDAFVAMLNRSCLAFPCFARKVPITVSEVCGP